MPSDFKNIFNGLKDEYQCFIYEPIIRANVKLPSSGYL